MILFKCDGTRLVGSQAALSRPIAIGYQVSVEAVRREEAARWRDAQAQIFGNYMRYS
jgi:hypothetical protein